MAEVRYDEEAGTYALGADVDGVFVPFVTKSAGYVQGLVSRGQQADAQQPAQPATAPPASGDAPPPQA